MTSQPRRMASIATSLPSSPLPRRRSLAAVGESGVPKRMRGASHGSDKDPRAARVPLSRVRPRGPAMRDDAVSNSAAVLMMLATVLGVSAAVFLHVIYGADDGPPTGIELS